MALDVTQLFISNLVDLFCAVQWMVQMAMLLNTVVSGTVGVDRMGQMTMWFDRMV